MARKAFWGLIGVALIFLILELVFRALPVSTSTETGYYSDPLILTYPPNHQWLTATGWDLRNVQVMRSNRQGYAANRDFQRDARAVALVGDSYIEASMLADADRPAIQLERELKFRPVYSFGSPGTSLLDYAEKIRFAHENFDIRDFVVFVERGDIRQSFCGSGNISGPCLDSRTFTMRTEAVAPPSKVKQILRQSALAQYLFSQLKVTPKKLDLQLFATTKAESTKPVANPTMTLTSFEADANAVVDEFFRRIKPHVLGRLIIIFDSDRNSLYQQKISNDPARAKFMNLARSAGATVIDTEPLFQAHLSKSPLKLDVSPNDAHLNALGVAIISRAAASELATK